MLKITAKLLNITDSKLEQYPGDDSGNSLVVTGEGMAGKGETAQNYGLPGFISNPPNDDKAFILTIGNLDLLLGAINYQVDPPTNRGESKQYSTDENGVEKAVQYLDDQGVHTFNNGTKEAARNGDKVTVTIPAGTFIVSVSGGSGAPAVGVLNPAPIDVDGTIKEGTNEVIFP